MAAANPYVGPRPFGTEDRGRFFGRDGEVNQLVGLLYASRVLILFAGSGAGKTSLLQAGTSAARSRRPSSPSTSPTGPSRTA